MKKALVAALCTTLAAGALAPAFAKDHTLNGFYRVRGMMFNHPLSEPTALEKDQKPTKLVDQRFRVKWDMKLNEFVTTTYFGEIDFVWGDLSYGQATVSGAAPAVAGTPVTTSANATRNKGGGLGGDTVNLETKNLYVDVKVPDMPVAFRVGLQGFADNWSLAYIFGDMAGLKATTKTAMFDATLGWFKWNEGSGVREDDRDLFAAQLAFKPMGDLKLGADLYWVNDNAAETPDLTGANNRTVGTQADLYFAGLNAAYKLPMVDVSGWALYNFGEVRPTGANNDKDVSGFAASAKGTFSIAGAKAGLRLTYVSSDDDATDKDIESPVAPTQGEPVAFADTNMIIMMSDAMGITLGYLNGGLAMDRAGYEGWGLMAINFMADYNPPAVKNVYTKFGLGYFRALEDDNKVTKKEGKSLGTEAALRVGYKFADAVDVSLNGGYVWLGDFFDKTGVDAKTKATKVDPDNLYQVYAMLNINY